MNTTEFDPKFVQSASDHMNNDHRDAMVLMLQVFCGADWVEDAMMHYFDKEKMVLEGMGAVGKKETFTLPFEPPLEKPNQLRTELVNMVQKARAKLNGK
jgi:putative heme iron utilization protein